MKVIRLFGNHWRKVAVLLALIGVFGVACQLNVDSEPQQRSNLSLSLIGAPEDRDVLFDLTVRGPGMETIREVVDPSEEQEFTFEVPARADISFSLTARDDVYSGSVTRRFSPGDEANVEIPVHPGPVFVDVQDGLLYQVRDLGVDLDDPETGTWRSIDGTPFDANPVAAEYGPDGRLWIFAGGDVYAYRDLSGDPPVEDETVAGIGGFGQRRSLAVTDDYVFIFNGTSVFQYVIGSGAAATELNLPIGVIENQTETLLSEQFDDATAAGFQQIQDIAASDDGTLYLLYTTGEVDYDAALEAGFDDEFARAFREVFTEARLRNLVGRVLEEQFRETEEELRILLDVLDGLDFGAMIAILEAIADLEVDIEEDDNGEFRADDAELEQLILDLAGIIEAVLEGLFEQIDEFLVEFTDDENGNGEDIELEEFAQLVAFLLAFAYSEAEEEERENLIAIFEFLGELGGELPDAEAALGLLPPDTSMIEQVLPEDFDIRRDVLDGVFADTTVPRRFHAVVGVEPGAGIVHGPVLLGPTTRASQFSLAPSAALRFAGGSLYVAQTSEEVQIAEALSEMRSIALYGYGFEPEEPQPEFPGLLFYIEQRLDEFADDINGEGELEGEIEPSELAQFFDEESINDLTGRIEAAITRALGEPREVLGRIDTIRAEPTHRYSSSLRFRGSGGGKVSDIPSASPGLFVGPRRFAATRDGRLIVIDQLDDDDGGRLVRFRLGTESGWRVLENDLLRLFDTFEGT